MGISFKRMMEMLRDFNSNVIHYWLTCIGVPEEDRKKVVAVLNTLEETLNEINDRRNNVKS